MAEFVAANFPDKVALIFGSLRTKDTAQVIRQLSAIVDNVYTVSVDSPLALSAEQLRELFFNSEIVATTCGSMKEAFTRAMSEQRVIVICGSLYLVGEARRLVVVGDRK